jgi:hypothetical protein
MAKISDVFAGGYVTAAELGSTHHTAVIFSITIEAMGRERVRKPILELTNAQGQAWPSALVLNKTNALRLAAAFGDDTDEWPGKAIELWSEPVSFNGETVPGIHVEPVLAGNGTTGPGRALSTTPRAGAPTWDTPPGNDLNDEIPY